VNEQAEKTRKVTKDTGEEKTESRAEESSSRQEGEAPKDGHGEGADKRSPSSASQSDEGVGGSEGSAEKPGILPAAFEEDEMSVYPLREPSEDARWAVRTVWIWIGFGIASLIFIATLLILGAMYD
jgi:hypothetical protein